MNLLLIINPNDQDQELGIAIDRIMQELLWLPVKGFSYVYTKEVENEDINDLTSGIQDDIEAAVGQAEWENVRYLYSIGGTTPNINNSN